VAYDNPERKPQILNAYGLHESAMVRIVVRGHWLLGIGMVFLGASSYSLTFDYVYNTFAINNLWAVFGSLTIGVVALALFVRRVKRLGFHSAFFDPIISIG
jgi:hypothetical protein